MVLTLVIILLVLSTPKESLLVIDTESSGKMLEGITIQPDKFERQVYKSNEDYLDKFITNTCRNYGVSEDLIRSIIWFESGWDKDAVSYDGSCVGLMQISTRWNADRALRLGITDFMDPFNNVLLGIDLIAELTQAYPDDPYLVLMLYNMNHKTAKFLYSEGEITSYAIKVMERKEKLHGERTNKKPSHE